MVLGRAFFTFCQRPDSSTIFEGVSTPSRCIRPVSRVVARTDRETERRPTEDAPRRRRAGERERACVRRSVVMDATRADGISKLMIAEKEAQAIVGAAREGA